VLGIIAMIYAFQNQVNEIAKVHVFGVSLSPVSSPARRAVPIRPPFTADATDAAQPPNRPAAGGALLPRMQGRRPG